MRRQVGEDSRIRSRMRLRIAKRKMCWSRRVPAEDSERIVVCAANTCLISDRPKVQTSISRIIPSHIETGVTRAQPLANLRGCGEYFDICSMTAALTSCNAPPYVNSRSPPPAEPKDPPSPGAIYSKIESCPSRGHDFGLIIHEASTITWYDKRAIVE